MQIRLLFIIATVPVALWGLPTTALPDDRPNIILLMGDDHGWGDAGYQGHPFAVTPHLDQMAAEGLRFDRWYAAAPVCSPTRGSCLTGRHPFRYGVLYANVGCLKQEEICLAEILKEHGYATGHFGKWHLGTLTTQGADANRGGTESQAIYSPPWENGFDVCFSTESKVPTYDPMRNPSKVSRESSKAPEGSFYGTHYWTGPDQQVAQEQLRGDDSALIMDRVLPFIDSAVAKESPFLAVVWFHAPHNPVVASQEDRELYPHHPKGLYGQHYHGCITAMDRQIGRLREELNRLGIAENTMVWYSSDNGPESDVATGAGSAGSLRGRKRSLYEGGIRVPGLLVWPAKVSQPRTIEAPCVSSDYFPTILDVLGIELPNRPYDGISLLPLIEGLTTERGSDIGFQSGSQQALIADRYKLYSSDPGAAWELYDLIHDKEEMHDLSGSHPHLIEQLRQNLAPWVQSCENSLHGEDYDNPAAP